MALTRVSRHIIDEPLELQNINATGIGTFASLRVTGDLQVDGTTTTLDTVVTEVDRLEVSANNSTVGVAITQSGSGRGLSVDGDTVISHTGANPLDLYKYGTTAPTILMYGANGTQASPTQTLTGDVIGGLNMFGHGSSGFAGGPSVRINAIASENNGQTSNRGADIKIETVATGGTSLQERLRITSDGKVGIGTDNPALRAHIFSTANADAALIESTQNFATLRFKSALNTSGPTIGINGAGGLELDQKDTSKYISFAIGSERLRILNDGKVRVPDNGKFVAGDGDDLQIYNNGTHSYIDNVTNGALIIRNTSNDVDVVIESDDGSGGLASYFRADGSTGDAILYHYGNVKLATKSTGIQVTGQIDIGTTSIYGTGDISMGDSDQLRLGGGDDLRIYHDGSINRIRSDVLTVIEKNDSEDMASFMPDGAVVLFHNGSQRFETTSTGASITGNLNLGDDNSLYFGAGDDLEIKHIGGSFNNIQGSPELRIQSASKIQLKEFGTTEVFANFIADGAVELFYDNSKKLETTTTGAKVTGALEVTQEYPSIRPTLDLNFAATKTLDRRITFRRNSIGTYIDDMGILKYASNNVPRFDHNIETGESLGLLIEAASTNLFLHGENFTASYWTKNGGGNPATTVTADQAAAPDGTMTADYIDYTTATGNSQNIERQFDSSPAGKTYTASVFIKGTAGQTINLTLDGYGVNGSASQHTLNGSWQRFSITRTYPGGHTQAAIFRFGCRNLNHPSTGTATQIYAWGAQLEQIALSTSYIPSSSTGTVSRAQDTAKITGTNFTDFYNQTEGTLVAHYYSTVDDSYLAQLENSATPGDDRIGFVNYAGYQGFVETGNSTQASLDNGTPTVGGINKVAFAFKANDFAVSLNSASPTTDTSGTMPTVDRMMIGSRYGGAYDVLKSTLRHLSYYPKRLPNAQLQGLTQQ